MIRHRDTEGVEFSREPKASARRWLAAKLNRLCASGSQAVSGEADYPRCQISLSPREWAAAGVLVLAALTLVPALWERIEPLELSPNYRIPYELSADYWLFGRLARASAATGEIVVLGDSVVWGHYVGTEDTLPGRLNALGERHFVNLGVDGIHPAAMLGLIRHYGSAISGRNVVVHCNLLWLSSRRHDLREEKEFPFNHPRLVPQFYPRIPCYAETVSGRLAIAIGRELPFRAWTGHLRQTCFDGQDIPAWTIEHPYQSPLAAIRRPKRPGWPSPPEDTAEAPSNAPQPGGFEPAWVDLETSFQWSCLEAAVQTLRARGNRVFVIVGPFNEHMLAGASLETYRRLVKAAAARLEAKGIPHWVPAALPSRQYADASHPLPQGYDALARQLLATEAFASFLAGAEPAALARENDK